MKHITETFRPVSLWFTTGLLSMIFLPSLSIVSAQPPPEGELNNDPPPFTIQLSIPAGEVVLGPKYRKIGINGFPLSDEKPQAQEESDQFKEETYIDAFNLNLRHSTSDVYVPIPGSSDLALTVRREAASEAWRSKSGSRPDFYGQYGIYPFGVGWRSNLGAHLRFVVNVNVHSIYDYRYERWAYVVDENGATHRFVMYPANAIEWSPDKEKTPQDQTIQPLPVGGFVAVPAPGGSHEANAYSNSLTYENGAWVFRKKFGTTLKFSASNVNSGKDAENRKVFAFGGQSGDVSSIFTEFTLYHRLEQVEDRLGNTLQLPLPPFLDH